MQSSSITFKVSGNCEMCKTRIEKAASGVKGVKSVYWDIQTKLLRVDFDKEVKTEEIHKAVAKAGHDTDKIKADNKTYKSLPECCKYRS